MRASLVLLAAMTLVTGIAYPLAVRWLSAAVHPQLDQRHLLMDGDRVLGSTMLPLPFTADGDFWPRPSATAPRPWSPFDRATGQGSQGSNLGTTNPTLRERVQERASHLAAGQVASVSTLVPIDLVTMSASGLDPHISVASAHYQAERVARARGQDLAVVERMIGEATESQSLALFGEPVVHVLRLNAALDRWTLGAARPR